MAFCGFGVFGVIVAQLARAGQARRLQHPERLGSVDRLRAAKVARPERDSVKDRAQGLVMPDVVAPAIIQEGFDAIRDYGDLRNLLAGCPFHRVGGVAVERRRLALHPAEIRPVNRCAALRPDRHRPEAAAAPKQPFQKLHGPFADRAKSPAAPVISGVSRSGWPPSSRNHNDPTAGGSAMSRR